MGIMSSAGADCACGRARVHDGSLWCRQCWWEKLQERSDPFPDCFISGQGIRVNDDVGRFGMVGEYVQRGERTRVHDLAYVGSRPFEFVRMDGVLKGFPRCGHVILGDDVEVFPFANIDAGFLGDTIVGDGTKIDHYVHVGHNSVIGKHVLLCAKANIGGHVHIGDRTFVGMGATIIPRITVGSDVMIGAGAVVIADVPDHGRVVGNPAHELRGQVAPSTK